MVTNIPSLIKSDFDITNRIIDALNQQNEVSVKASEISPEIFRNLANQFQNFNPGHFHIFSGILSLPNGTEYKLPPIDMDHIILWNETPGVFVQIYGWSHACDDDVISGYLQLDTSVFIGGGHVVTDESLRKTVKHEYIMIPPSPNGFVDFNWNTISSESTFEFHKHDDSIYCSAKIIMKDNPSKISHHDIQ